jgi:hypothetical protein
MESARVTLLSIPPETATTRPRRLNDLDKMCRKREQIFSVSAAVSMRSQSFEVVVILIPIPMNFSERIYRIHFMNA